MLHNHKWMYRHFIIIGVCMHTCGHGANDNVSTCAWYKAPVEGL